MSEPKALYEFKTVLVNAPAECEILTEEEKAKALVDEMQVLEGEAESLRNQIERLDEVSRRKEAEIAGLRTQVERLTEQLAGARKMWSEWHLRAKAAEQINGAVFRCLQEKMILMPTNQWQLGFRSGPIAVLEVIQPVEEGEP